MLYIARKFRQIEECVIQNAQRTAQKNKRSKPFCLRVTTRCWVKIQLLKIRDIYNGEKIVWKTKIRQNNRFPQLQKKGMSENWVPTIKLNMQSHEFREATASPSRKTYFAGLTWECA